VCDSGDLGSGSSIPKAKAVVRKVLKGHINKVALRRNASEVVPPC
jgi:hypothetical protein